MLVISIQKNLIKYGHSNYVETFKDCIRMEVIFTDFCPIDTPYKNLHSHVDDNVINW